MLKEMLTFLDVQELESNQYYFLFESNLQHYLVYRKNSYQLFSLETFSHIDPKELITGFFIDEEGFRQELAKRQADYEALNKLKDVSFNKAIGQFLKLRYLENTKDLENAPQSDIDFFSKLEVLRESFFLTKYGLSIFSNINNELPTGLIYFNRFNCKNIGSPRKYLKRITSNSVEVLNEETIIVFSPYTLKECIESGKSHFKDNFYILSDCRQLHKEDLFENFSIHIRPTTHELANYLRYVSYYLNQSGLMSNVIFTEDNLIKYRSVCENYARLRINYLSKLESQKSVLTGQKPSEDFRISLLKKNHKPGADVFEVIFPKTSDNIIVFVQYFLMSFFSNSKKVDLKRITIIYYEKDFPEIIEENFGHKELEFEDNLTPVSDENSYDFDEY